MDVQLIGEQISRLRKQAGLTQEELGRTVGVSTQAVSRWECGGAPDTTLLPAIADALHTSIDALFGRDASEPVNPETFLYSWIMSLPKEQRWMRLTHMLTNVAMEACIENPNLDTLPMASCEQEYEGYLYSPLSFGSADSVLVVASYAKDMAYLSLYPEPEDGYAAYFADCDTYRKFFTMLAMPNCLELLLDLMAAPANGKLQMFYITEASAAQRLGISQEDAAVVIRALTEAKFLYETTVELESGCTHIYGFDPQLNLIPLLYDACHLARGPYSNFWNCRARKKPYLCKAAGEGTQISTGEDVGK